MKTAPGEFIPTRESLLSRLKDHGDQESWKVFFDTYWRLIYNTGRKAGLTDAEAQDAVQDTIISVMKSMPNFKYRSEGGSFKKWLLRLTQWRIVDQFRKRQPTAESTTAAFPQGNNLEDSEVANEPVDPKWEKAWDEEWETNLLEVAMDRIKKKVDPLHYQIFDLCVMKEWPILKVAKTMRLNPGNIYLIKHRISKLLKSELLGLREKPI